MTDLAPFEPSDLDALADDIRSAAKRRTAHHYAELADEAERDLPGLATQ